MDAVLEEIPEQDSSTVIEEHKDDVPLKKLTFAEQMAKNAEIKEKLRKERAEANKAVLKSYRIK